MGLLNFFKTSAPKPLRADLGEAGQKSQAGKNIEWQALQQLGNERR